MKTKAEASIIQECPEKKAYPNSIQKLAVHFSWIASSRRMVEVADALSGRQDLAVLCIVDEQRRPLGILRREELFLRLGKPFGRELLKNTPVDTAGEPGLVISGDTNIFAETLAAGSREQMGTVYQDTYIILTGPDGEFTGLLPVRKYSRYMAEITNRDIETARVLQERLLENADDPGDQDIRVDAWSRPAKGVGGDFYCLRNIGPELFFGTLCDVSGKGITAALVVSMVWGFLRAYDMRRGLRNLLLDLNTAMISSFHLERYLTGFFFIHDRKKQKLYLADMGHAHSVFIRNGREHSLEKSRVNLPVGIGPEIDPRLCVLQLRPGDALLLYTDGIPEQDNPLGEEFGDQRLAGIILSCLKSGGVLSRDLPEELDAFRNGSPQHDDMTFLLFRF
ncbi:PP2C family protein-serine/threonine phosphatase [Breznakiella homolactica]|uniref:SpoIIE family protein phosphatase n=1 Tax=Breznakiella homolactica TaxID=2798577 RepID=A0A7T7XJQ8_9SPIR|nr:SpoIIE family protein phosphatase [Breznakiella homolactica]QQO07680.1 SpoIIE family protein phosphatase [Breznakiella homolactica]